MDEGRVPDTFFVENENGGEVNMPDYDGSMGGAPNGVDFIVLQQKLLKFSKTNDLENFKNLMSDHFNDFQLLFFDLKFENGLDLVETIFQTPNLGAFVNSVIETIGCNDAMELLVANGHANRSPIKYILDSKDSENFRQFLDKFIEYSIIDMTLMKTMIHQLEESTGCTVLESIYYNLTATNFEDWKSILTQIFQYNKDLEIGSDLEIEIVLEIDDPIVKKNLLNLLSEFCDFSADAFNENLDEILKGSLYIQLLFYIRSGNIDDEKFEETFEKYFNDLEEQTQTDEFKKVFQKDCQKFFEIAYDMGLETVLAKIFSYNEFDIYRIKTRGLFNVIEIVCLNGFDVILKSLVMRKDFRFEMYRVNDAIVKTVLDLCVKGMYWSKNKSSTKMSQNHKNCIDYIIDSPKFTKYLNRESYTPVKTALLFHCEYAVLKLLNRGYYMQEEEFKMMEPEILGKFLDSRVEGREGAANSDYDKLVNIDYSFLAPREKIYPKHTLEIIEDDKEKPKEEIKRDVSDITVNDFFLNITIKDDLKTLVKHPVIKLYLSIQDNNFTNYYFLSLLLCLLFLILPIIKISVYKVTEKDQDTFEVIAALIMALYCTAIYLMKMKRKVFDSVNCLLTICCWIYFLGCKMLSVPKTSEHSIFSLIIVLATFEIIYQISTLSVTFSVNILMCKMVCKAFMKLFLVFAIVFCGFGCAFFILSNTDTNDNDNANKNVTTPAPLPDCNSTNPDSNDEDKLTGFKTFDKIVLKIIVMFTGEFDASDFEYTSWGVTVVLIFFVLAQIVIFNLSNALAIDDVEKLRADTEYLKLKQVIANINLFSKFAKDYGSKCLKRLEVHKKFDGSFVFRDNAAKPSEMDSNLFNTLMTIASDSEIQKELENRENDQVNAETVEILEKMDHMNKMIQKLCKNTNVSLCSSPGPNEGGRTSTARYSTVSNVSRFYYQ